MVCSLTVSTWIDHCSLVNQTVLFPSCTPPFARECAFTKNGQVQETKLTAHLPTKFHVGGAQDSCFMSHQVALHELHVLEQAKLRIFPPTMECSVNLRFNAHTKGKVPMRKGRPHLAKFVAVLVYMPRPIQTCPLLNNTCPH